MKGTAIQLNDTPELGNIGDLKIIPIRDVDGFIISGIVIGSTLEQNQALILMANAGEIKQYPTLGVGLKDGLLGNELLEYRHKIRREFSKDDLKVTTLDLYNSKNITIKAKY